MLKARRMLMAVLLLPVWSLVGSNQLACVMYVCVFLIRSAKWCVWLSTLNFTMPRKWVCAWRFYWRNLDQWYGMERRKWRGEIYNLYLDKWKRRTGKHVVTLYKFGAFLNTIKDCDMISKHDHDLWAFSVHAIVGGLEPSTHENPIKGSKQASCSC